MPFAMRVLDVGEHHKEMPDCPLLLAQTPGGAWYCLRCGVHILTRNITVEEILPPEEKRDEETL